MSAPGQHPTSPPLPYEDQQQSSQSREQEHLNQPASTQLYQDYPQYQQYTQHPQFQYGQTSVQDMAGLLHSPELARPATSPSPNPASRPTSMVAQELSYATGVSPTPYQYGYTPPTPPSQFSSQHTTPHMSFVPNIGTPDTRYSRLIPVNTEQDRAFTASEEHYVYRENRSTGGSTGLDSITTIHENDHDTGKIVAQQPHPYKEIVSPPIPAQDFNDHSKPEHGLYDNSPEVTPTPYYYSQQPDPIQFKTEEGQVQVMKTKRKERRKIMGIPMSVIIGILVIFSAMAIGLGVYFGTRKKHPSTSKNAAYHLTGLAAGQHDGGDGDMNLFFQHQSGFIRRMTIDSAGHSSGGEYSTNVTKTAKDAKHGTPIAVVTNTNNGNHYFYLYFIGSNNQLRERIGTQVGNGEIHWDEGPLSGQNIVALDDPNAGLQVCYATFYNGTDATDPGPFGMRLWYAPASTTIRSYYRTFSDSQWTKDSAADYVANGKAGIGCYTWAEGSIYYLMVMNLNDEMNILYRDAKQDQGNTNYYKNTSVVIADLMPNTSIGYTGAVFAQHSNGWLTGFNVKFNGAQTTMDMSQGGGQITTNQMAIGGSHFAVTQYHNGSNMGPLQVYLQLPAGNDVTQSVYDGNNKWDYTTLNIPTT